jgi:hypothetical protein
MLPHCCRIAAVIAASSVTGIFAAGCATRDLPSEQATFAPQEFCRDVIQTLATGDKAGAERVFKNAASPAVDTEGLKAEIDKTVDAIFGVIVLRTNGQPLGYAETLVTPTPQGHVSTIERWQARNSVNIYFGCSVRDQPIAGLSRVHIQVSDTARSARRSMDDFHRAGQRMLGGIDV